MTARGLVDAPPERKLAKVPSLDMNSLERFDAASIPSVPKNPSVKDPAITISKSGRFIVNKKLVEMLELKSGSALSFFHDKEEEPTWYFMREDRSGVVLKDLKAGKQTQGCLEFTSPGLRMKMMENIKELAEGSCRIEVSTEVFAITAMVGTRVYALFTRSIHKRKKRSDAKE